MGFDISIVNVKLIDSTREYLSLRRDFKYPTGEEIAVQFKIEFPLLVADITEDCILGVDFLRKAISI